MCKLPLKSRAYLSMFQKDHKCYGTFQHDTQYQNLCCSACTTPLLPASLSHKHLEAKPMRKAKSLTTSTIYKGKTSRLKHSRPQRVTNLSRPGISLLQAHIGFQLLKFRVDTSTRGIEKPAQIRLLEFRGISLFPVH